MKTRDILFIVYAASLAIVGCGRLEDPSEPLAADSALPPVLEMRAAWEQPDDTKTILQEDGVSVWWSPGDDIQFYRGNYDSFRYRSTSTEPSPSVAFHYYASVATGPGYSNPDICYKDRCVAVYPYDPSCEGEADAVTIPVSPFQKGVAGTFAPRALPSMANEQERVHEDDPWIFYHVCGGARFSVSQEGITQVIFKSIGGELISGKVRTAFGPDGRPAVLSVPAGVDSVMVFAKDGFEPGKNYFAVMIPQTLAQGLTVKFIRGGQSAVSTIAHPIDVRRARFGKLDNLDQGLSFQDDPTIPTSSEGNISFADPKIKACLVEAFDANGDGEISFWEAAGATSLVGVFGTETDFDSFDEFEYFTGVHSVPDEFFKDWSNLTSIRFPNGLTHIGESAFENCAKLDGVEFPDGLESLGSLAFCRCSSLTSIRIPESVTQLGLSICAYCSNLNLIEIGSIIEDLQKPLITVGSTMDFVQGGLRRTFGRGSVAKVIVSGNPKSIPDYTFCNLGAGEVVLPSSVTSIGKWAFYCYYEVGVRLLTGADNVTAIGESAFRNCRLTAIPFSDKIEQIGSYAFYGCEDMAGDLVLPNSLTSLGPYKVFYECKGLTSVDLRCNISEIGLEMFYNCSNLSSVRLPSALTTVGMNAFRGCSLQSVSLPSSLRAINQYAFSYTPLVSVELPEGLETMGEGAFAYCSSLSSVNIPETLTSIPANAFRGCALPSIEIPENITSIGYWAFSNCSSASYVSLPSSLTQLGEGAFEGCGSLRYVLMNAVAPPEGTYNADWHLSGSGRFTPFTGPIYVPDASVETYRTDTYFSEYESQIRPMSEFNSAGE